MLWLARRELARGAADLDRRLSQLPVGDRRASQLIFGCSGRMKCNLVGAPSEDLDLGAFRSGEAFCGGGLCPLARAPACGLARGPRVPRQADRDRGRARSPRQWRQAPILCCCSRPPRPPDSSEPDRRDRESAQSLAAATFPARVADRRRNVLQDPKHRPRGDLAICCSERFRYPCRFHHSRCCTPIAFAKRSPKAFGGDVRLGSSPRTSAAFWMSSAARPSPASVNLIPAFIDALALQALERLPMSHTSFFSSSLRKRWPNGCSGPSPRAALTTYFVAVDRKRIEEPLSSLRAIFHRARLDRAPTLHRAPPELITCNTARRPGHGWQRVSARARCAVLSRLQAM